jgi:ribosome recycling factor
MADYLNQFKDQAQKVAVNFQKKMSGLRTGRVQPNLVENILVDCYGQKMPLIQLAGISTPDPKTIMIQPWDKSVAKEIEKTLSQSNLGANVSVVDNIIRLNFPSPTEESRKEIIKVLHQEMEEARVAMRKVRESIKDQIVSAEKDGDISEDEKFKLLEELDEQTRKENDELKNLADKKEKEIITI